MTDTTATRNPMLTAISRWWRSPLSALEVALVIAVGAAIIAVMFALSQVVY